THLPAAIGKLRALEHLFANGNQLSELPEAVGELSRLQTLQVGYNRLTALPEQIRRLKGLTGLELVSNTGLDLPVEIIGKRWSCTVWEPEELSGGEYVDETFNLSLGAKSAWEIIDYYFRTRGGSRPLNEAKIILV